MTKWRIENNIEFHPGKQSRYSFGESGEMPIEPYGAAYAPAKRLQFSAGKPEDGFFKELAYPAFFAVRFWKWDGASLLRWEGEFKSEVSQGNHQSITGIVASNCFACQVGV